jgi:hypothetical protein
VAVRVAVCACSGDRYGAVRSFTMANSDYPNHVVLAQDLHAYLR